LDAKRRVQSGKRGAATQAASKGGFQVPKIPKKKRGAMGTKAQRLVTGSVCGAKKKGGGNCTLAAGWGTNHLGIGACKLHGGSMPNHVKSAVKQEAKVFFGTPMEINPLDALMWMIRMTAGEIQWLSEQMAEVQEADWIETGIMGKQFHIYARERRLRQDSLARYSAQAISLGIAERAIKMAETYADLLARLIQGILGDLDLTPEQRAKAPMVVRKHLIAIDGGANATAAANAQLALAAGNGE
jgi:hypothetical protein